MDGKIEDTKESFLFSVVHIIYFHLNNVNGNPEWTINYEFYCYYYFCSLGIFLRIH
jgi:hypothetical protein